jgi:hypothetical protein
VVNGCRTSPDSPDSPIERAQSSGGGAMFEKITDNWAECDLCGEKPCDSQVFRNEKHLCVCCDCKRKLEEMPKKSREYLENDLIGNVV